MTARWCPRPYLGVYAKPLSFLGLPFVTAPLRDSGQMPIGVQIVAGSWQETDALRIAWSLARGGVTAAMTIDF